jgi:malonyl-CoA O-methyltransferase
MINRRHSDAQPHKRRIAAHFNAAAQTYDSASALQRSVAQDLAGRIARLPLSHRPRILEIGCGSGALYGYTQARLPLRDLQWILTDIAPAMLDQALQRYPACAGLLMDGEWPACKQGSIDLIASNLTVQWFVDIPAALAQWRLLLNAQGAVIFSTFGAGSFREWICAHRDLGFKAATPDYPDAQTLLAWLRQAFPGAQVSVDTCCLVPAQTPLEFLRTLRTIGAQTPRPDHRPLSAGQLRAVVRHLESNGVTGISHIILIVQVHHRG